MEAEANGGGELAMVVADEAGQVIAELLGAGHVDRIERAQSRTGNAAGPVQQSGELGGLGGAAGLPLGELAPHPVDVFGADRP